MPRPSIIALLALCAGCCVAQASPYTPARGDQVIEQLPRRFDAAQRQLQQLRAQLRADPSNLRNATMLAQQYIATARSDSDPRYLGYAQAALAPWWQLAAPPPAVRILRATLRQSTHQFDAALADLNAALASDPGNVQAWLTRATVQTVQGDYPGATASCARLSLLASDLISASCIANIGALTGRATSSDSLLATTLQRSGTTEPDTEVWVLTLLAEIAARRGQAGLAEARFRRALALRPGDGYLLGAYADFLLDARRAQEALALVKDQTRVDALLLRYALALQQLPGDGAALRGAIAELAARFAAAAQRGDTVHQREQARFELQLRGDGAAALALARANWAVQKEPADLRLYLEAAQRSGQSAAARPALDWARKHKIEDVAIARLTRQLAGGA